MDEQDSGLSSLLSNQKFFQICGVAGIAGSLIAVITDFIGIFVVDGYNPFSQTISSLAIGDYAWIQDVGLNLYGIGLLVCAIALWRWNLGDWRWRFGSVLVFLLGIDIIVISEHDQYAGLPGHTGTPIHLQAVYVLGILFPLICFLLSFGFRRISRKWQYFSWITAAVWLIFAPPFFQVPTALDGLYERFISVILLGWTIVTSWLIFRQGSSLSSSKTD